ncbi:lipid kinase YegS [Pseudoalteromonas tunicata]|uniref:lipid kinase YegS n=1 Tax=Pseudoalteromonas tunicata TaxID=314281 RepID=UPI00273E427E|nr:lipid kinase YegS [Pseudoalteromonas tunicata]MDP4983162.1 lipid kinase YegS [Pseudoalteromonas tunicata]
MTLRLLLNGKKAALESVREAVSTLRNRGYELEVRVTWEAGDMARLVNEAIEEQCTRLIAGGGDGTLNEVVNALMQHPKEQRPELAILPLGTANDFATACQVPTDITLDALTLACEGESTFVDVIKAGDDYVINVATGGFGAQVTATTPPALKNFLGGGAYTLTGLINALDFQPFQGIIKFDDRTLKSSVILAAICNGPQAGGGQILSSISRINDGKMELVALYDFPAAAISSVIGQLSDPQGTGEFVKRYQATKVQWQADELMPINLDGEPISSKDITFTLCPLEIKLVLPNNCPLLD